VTFSRLTLALSGEAAVASTKPAGNTIAEHHGEPGSGLVRFNALLGVRDDPPERPVDCVDVEG
jgi:hypothetical protein